MVAMLPGTSFSSNEHEAIPILGYRNALKQAPEDQRLSKLVAQMRRTLLRPPTNVERLHALFLDGGRTLLAEASLGNGTNSALALSMRDLFSRALSAGATGIILAHNHPSGECRPSQKDFEATRCIAGLGRALEIELLDHLIFTQTAVYSMRARGEL